MRLDLVNISKQTVYLVSIEHILPPEFLVKSFSSPGDLKGDAIFLSNQELGPLSVQSIKFSIQTAQLGTIRIAPQITYIDNSGETKFSTTRIVEVNVGSTPIQMGGIDSNENKKSVNFGSESAEAIFNFLQKAYQQDYLQMKVPQERAGWRTLMEIVRGARVSRYSVYGSSAGSQAIAKLQHGGLVEVRIFEGQRGRGGRIIKVRIRAEKTS
jgi:hypothetical protein